MHAGKRVQNYVKSFKGEETVAGVVRCESCAGLLLIDVIRLTDVTYNSLHQLLCQDLPQIKCRATSGGNEETHACSTSRWRGLYDSARDQRAFDLRSYDEHGGLQRHEAGSHCRYVFTLRSGRSCLLMTGDSARRSFAHEPQGDRTDLMVHGFDVPFAPFARSFHLLSTVCLAYTVIPGV